MRWFAVLAFLFVLTGSSRAAGPDDQYLDIYNEILQADTLQQNGRAAGAAEKYLDAQTALRRLKDEHPDWNTAIVSFRLDYLAEQLHSLAKVLPSTNAPPPQAVVPAPTAPAPVPPEVASEVANLREQVRSLTAANAELGNKLKEALSVQPAAVSPRELAKAEEKMIALQKEKDLLSVALEQAKAGKASTPSPEGDQTGRQLAEAKAALAEAQQKIAADSTQIEALKSALPPQDSHPPEDWKGLIAERDKLKDELAVRTRDLADAEAHRDSGVTELRAQLAAADRQRDELKAQLAAAPTAPTPTTAPTDTQADQLRARLAVLEAQAVPYTPEELAMMNPNPATAPAHAPAPESSKGPAPAEGKHIVHSVKDLPPGAGTLMKEAGRDAMERNYAKAAEKYEEILRQDENNVYVLEHLANAQFALGQLDACEKTVTRSLALDPDDPASLYTLGILRFRQEKVDEALDALSRSAKYSPTNAGTQYYLGNALAEKGMRTAAETAFRKALQFEPDYSDAHYSLACVYASEKPPSLALARWHYHRALELGHNKNLALEKLLVPAP
jgi:tetratricopeptide (TPR) repeat protein